MSWQSLRHQWHRKYVGLNIILAHVHVIAMYVEPLILSPKILVAGYHYSNCVGARISNT